MDQQTPSPYRIAKYVQCVAVVLAIWGVVGWWLKTTPGWPAVVTGCCVGLNAWREPSRGHGGRRGLLEIVALVLFCWTLILVGRFVCTVAAVNHDVVWLAYRATTEEDGMAILAGDVSDERNDKVAQGDIEISSALAI